jgi:hypothetical protein
MAGFSLPTRFSSLRRSKTSKGKEPVQTFAPTNGGKDNVNIGTQHPPTSSTVTGLSLPTRFSSFRRSTTTTGKQPAKPSPSTDGDQDSVQFDPREFDPFDQPDMSLAPNGRPAAVSRLDPYSIVESPQQTLTQYLHSSMRRANTTRPSPSDGAPLRRFPRNSQPRSFEKILGYHVARAESTFVGPSQWINPDYQIPDRQFKSFNGCQRKVQTENASRPTSWPPGVSTPVILPKRRLNSPYDAVYPSIFSQRRPFTRQSQPKIISPRFNNPMPPLMEVQEEQKFPSPYDAVYPLKLSRRGFTTVGGSQPKIISPRFSKPMSPLMEAQEEQIWATAAQILEPRTDKPVPVFLNQCLETQLKRRVSNRSPDSGISGVGEDAKEKEKIDNQHSSETSKENQEVLTSEEPQRLRTRKHRSSSCPPKRSNSWIDSSEGQHISGSSTQSFDKARIHDSKSSNDGQSTEEDLEKGVHYKFILQSQDELKDALAEGHLQKIMNAARDATEIERTRQIRKTEPVKIQDVRELKFVSHIQWTPTKETMMTSAISATVEDAGEVDTKEEKGFKTKINSWFKRSGRTRPDCIFPCPLGEHALDKCQERRVQRWPGIIPGKIC